MTRSLLWGVPLVAVGAALLGAAVGPVLGTALGLVLGVVCAAVLWSLQAARVRRAARQVNLWAGDEQAEPLTLDGAAGWRELATAVNAVGAQLRTGREELRDLVPWTERLVASLEPPAFVFGPDGRLTATNDAGRVLSGRDETAELPTPLSTLGSTAMADAAREALETGSLVAVGADHGGRELHITASPLDDHVLVVVTDHTQERRVEALRRDFVVNASHELKTPATAIAALAEALQVAAPDRTPQIVERLQEEAERLVRMVHDLLDLRRLEEGSQLEATPVDLVELVRASVQQRRAAADEAGLTLDVELPERAVVTGVRRELALVLDNLLTNAIQYSRPGGTVTVRVGQRDGAHVLTVADTGVGIPSGDLDRIFERFYRVDVARSRDRGGTGLGLSIVRNAVERHGGSVQVESLLGSGSTFTVVLPVGSGR